MIKKEKNKKKFKLTRETKLTRQTRDSCHESMITK
jgi:hypothetical protein